MAPASLAALLFVSFLLVKFHSALAACPRTETTCNTSSRSVHTGCCHCRNTGLLAPAARRKACGCGNWHRSSIIQRINWQPALLRDCVRRNLKSGRCVWKLRKVVLTSDCSSWTQVPIAPASRMSSFTAADLNGQVGQRSDARLQQRGLGGSAARGPGGLLGGDLLRVLQTAPDQTKQGWNGSSATQSPLNVAATSCTHTKTPSISLLTTSNFEVQSNAWGRKQEWRWQQNQLRTVSCTKASVHLKTFN